VDFTLTIYDKSMGLSSKILKQKNPQASTHGLYSQFSLAEFAKNAEKEKISSYFSFLNLLRALCVFASPRELFFYLPVPRQ
jgi:hypothetical protein